MHLMTRSLLLGVLMPLLVAAPPTDSMAAPAATQLRIYQPVADTFVDAVRPQRSFDRAKRLRVRGTPQRTAYLRFAVTGISGRVVSSVRLRLQVRHATGGLRVRLLDNSAWELRPLTAANVPLLGSSQIGALAPGAHGSVEIDLGRAIVEDGLYTLALTAMTRDDAVLLSSEARHQPPALIVEVDAASAAAALGALAGAASVGFEDFSFGPNVDANDNRATAHKPESKLWYVDSTWWATLYDPANPGHRIHRLDPSTQTWIDTGILVDERAHSRQDVLWDGQKLYVTSHFGYPTGTPAQNRLLRYSYSAPTRTFTPDPGFPADISGGGTEAMTLAKDTTSTLWIAYTLGNQVMVNNTIGGVDTQWGTPFALPVPEGVTVTADDIAGIVALQGEVGVLWSNQATSRDYFAVHVDGAPRSAWTEEIAGQGGNLADDHLNMKLAADGRLFAAVKTSYTSAGATLVGLLVRSPTGTWSSLKSITTVDFNPTRPQCLLDESARQVYVFYSLNQTAIYYKTSSMDAIAFAGGAGTPLIESDVVLDINNPTSTKQGVGPAASLVVVASNPSTTEYWHAFLPLGAVTTTTRGP